MKSFDAAALLPRESRAASPRVSINLPKLTPCHGRENANGNLTRLRTLEQVISTIYDSFPSRFCGSCHANPGFFCERHYNSSKCVASTLKTPPVRRCFVRGCEDW